MKRILSLAAPWLMVLALAVCAAAAEDAPSGPPEGAEAVEAGFPPAGAAWTVRIQGPGLAYEERRTVLADDQWLGRPVHRVRSKSPKGGERVDLYDKASGNFITSLVDGQPAGKLVYHPDNAMFSWPMWPGKTWSKTVSLSDAHRDKWPYPVKGEVEGFEVVKVPAGTFRALKAVVGDPTRGLWSLTYWYHPESRLVVRSVMERFQKDKIETKLFKIIGKTALEAPVDAPAPPESPALPKVDGGSAEAMVEIPDPAPPTPEPGPPKAPKNVKPLTTVEVSEDNAAQLPAALLQLQQRILSGGEAAAGGGAGVAAGGSAAAAAAGSAIQGPKAPDAPDVAEAGIPDAPASASVAAVSGAPAAPEAPAQPVEYRLSKLVPSQDGDAFVLSIKTAGPPGGYTGTFARNPYRVILDLKGRWGYDGPDAVAPGRGLVKMIRVERLPDKLRLVLEMAGDRPVKPSVERKPDGLSLTVQAK